MSERHAETQRSITMIIGMPDATTQAMTVAVDIERWFGEEGAIEYRTAVHCAVIKAAQRLIRLAAGRLNR